DRATRPCHQRRGILQYIRRGLVIAHAELRPVGVGPELTHAAGGEVRAVGIVDAQIQGIVVDECEEELIAVQARAAEHAPRAHPAQAAELIVNVVEDLAARQVCMQASDLLGPARVSVRSPEACTDEGLRSKGCRASLPYSRTEQQCGKSTHGVPDPPDLGSVDTPDDRKKMRIDVLET